MLRYNRINKNPRLSLIERFLLRDAIRKRADGLKIRYLDLDDPDPIFGKVFHALRIIKTYDRIRYDRLRKDLSYIFITDLSFAYGQYDVRLHACKLDTSFVRSRPAIDIALLIVHEATHARLFHYGIKYEEWRRPYVEAVCVRRELAFATKVPQGQRLQTKLFDKLSVVLQSPDYLKTSTMRRAEAVERKLIFKELGIPYVFIWLILAPAFLISLPRRCYYLLEEMIAYRKWRANQNRREEALRRHDLQSPRGAALTREASRAQQS